MALVLLLLPQAYTAPPHMLTLLLHGTRLQDWWNFRKGLECFVTEVEVYVHLEFYPQCASVLGVHPANSLK